MSQTPTFDRRPLLLFLASLPAASLSACASSALRSPLQGSSTPVSHGPVIDAHCHLFNVSDLPAERFLKHVFLHVYPKEAVSVLDIRKPDAVDGLIALMTWIVGRAKAPTAAEETRLLDRQRKPEKFDPHKDPNAAAVQEALAKYYVAKTGPAAVGGPPDSPGDDLIVDAILAAAGQKSARAVSGAPPSMAAARNTAKRAYESKTNLGTYLRWFSLITRWRYELTDQLAADYVRQGLKPRLLAPALVDYDLWLGQSVDRSPLPDQVEVMDRISQRPDGPAVHGYVAFDPLRQAYWERPAQKARAKFDGLALVQRAIKDSGFLGVKLYPPMGFKPIGNASVAQAYPEDVVADLGQGQVGAALDDALSRLYELCVHLDAPILAHAGDSNGSFDEASRRADPAHWLAVFERWPTLRVCLAHFGGFGAVSATAPAGAGFPQASWEWTLGRHIATHPTSPVFADVSYLAEVFAKPEARARTAANVKAFVSAFDPNVEHLVFGSDWIMLGLEGGYPTYADAVFDFFETDCEFDGDRMQRLLHGNASRFLGLERGAGSLRRLNSYYARYELPSERLRGLSVTSSKSKAKGIK